MIDAVALAQTKAPPVSPASRAAVAPLRLLGAPREPPAPRPIPRLEIPRYSAAAALALERELGIGHVLAQILVRRGLADPAAARAFLAADERHDPAAFAGIERALDAIRGADRAAAGGSSCTATTTSTASAPPRSWSRALRALGAEVELVPAQPHRRRLRPVRGDGAAPGRSAGRALIVTVDCGDHRGRRGRRRAGRRRRRRRHRPPRAARRRRAARLPDRPSRAVLAIRARTCAAPASPTSSLRRWGRRRPSEDLELVALATVADLVPLRGENRRLVREGLRALAATARPGLRALMAVARADPSALDSGTLGFRLAPRINAAGRLRRADAGLELLLDRRPGARQGDRRRARRASTPSAGRSSSGSCGRPRPRSRELGREPQRLRAVRSRTGIRAWSGSSPRGSSSATTAPRCWSRSTGDSTATGSGRSIPGFDLLGALHAAPAHLRRYGGHRAAAGLTHRRRRAARRSARRSRPTPSAVLTPELLEPVERVDAVVSGHELGLELAEELEALEPCGDGQPGAAAAGARRPLRRRAPDGGGRATPASRSSPAASAPARWRSAATAASPDEPGEPLDADLQARAQRLERRGRATAGAAPGPAAARRPPIELLAPTTPATTWTRR